MGFFGVKKRYPYPSVQRSLGAKAIINRLDIGQESLALSYVKDLDFIGRLTYTEGDLCTTCQELSKWIV
jgi:hypothetical protein